jgi:hypothetical protein
MQDTEKKRKHERFKHLELEFPTPMSCTQRCLNCGAEFSIDGNVLNAMPLIEGIEEAARQAKATQQFVRDHKDCQPADDSILDAEELV